MKTHTKHRHTVGAQYLLGSILIPSFFPQRLSQLIMTTDFTEPVIYLQLLPFNLAFLSQSILSAFC